MNSELYFSNLKNVYVDSLEFSLLTTCLQLQVATTIGADLAGRVVDVCAEQLEQFALTYKSQSLLKMLNII